MAPRQRWYCRTLTLTLNLTVTPTLTLALTVTLTLTLTVTAIVPIVEWNVLCCLAYAFLFSFSNYLGGTWSFQGSCAVKGV